MIVVFSIEQSNPMIQTLNTLALSFVGGVPFSSTLLQHYANPHSYGSKNYEINEQVDLPLY